jgi:hypothetical protein
MASIDEIQRMYAEALHGSETPSCFAVREGLFRVNKKGDVTVQDFDENGNFYDLPAEEQEQRMQQLKDRLNSLRR